MNPLYLVGLIAEWKAGLSFVLSATVGIVLLGQAGGEWVTFGSYYLEPPAKVALCHQPGTPAGQTLELPEEAVEGHLGHGDYLGSCEEQDLGQNVREERMEERQEERESREDAREEARAEREEAQAEREEARVEREEAREKARAEREEAREAAREERQEAREERREERQEARGEREQERGGPPQRGGR